MGLCKNGILKLKKKNNNNYHFVFELVEKVNIWDM